MDKQPDSERGRFERPRQIGHVHHVNAEVVAVECRVVPQGEAEGAIDERFHARLPDEIGDERHAHCQKRCEQTDLAPGKPAPAPLRGAPLPHQEQRHRQHRQRASGLSEASRQATQAPRTGGARQASMLNHHGKSGHDREDAEPVVRGVEGVAETKSEKQGAGKKDRCAAH